MSYLEKCLRFRRKVYDFWKSRGVPHTKAMHDWKIKFILSEIERADVTDVLEIGTCMGVSVLTMAYAIKLMGRKPNCWSIDVRYRGQDRVFEAFPSYADCVDMCVYPAGRTAEFAKIHDGLTFDLLNLDGDHTREGVKYDYENFSPLVRTGGLIIFDDVSASGKFKGDKNPNMYVRLLGDVTFIPNYPKPGEIGQSGPDFFAYMYKEAE